MSNLKAFNDTFPIKALFVSKAGSVHKEAFTDPFLAETLATTFGICMMWARFGVILVNSLRGAVQRVGGGIPGE